MKNLTSKQLKEMAKELQISGWWKMKKEELIKALQEKSVEIDQEAVDEPKEEVNVNTLTEEKDAPQVNVDAPERKNKQRLIEYKGKTQSLTAWARELGIRHQTLYNRIVMKGMEPAEAFEMPIRKAKFKGGDA